MPEQNKMKQKNPNTEKQSKRRTTTKKTPWSSFCSCCWPDIPPQGAYPSMCLMHQVKIPLEKTHFPLPSRHQLQIAPFLGNPVSSVYFSLSALGGTVRLSSEVCCHSLCKIISALDLKCLEDTASMELFTTPGTKT